MFYKSLSMRYSTHHSVVIFQRLQPPATRLFIQQLALKFSVIHQSTDYRWIPKQRTNNAESVFNAQTSVIYVMAYINSKLINIVNCYNDNKHSTDIKFTTVH